MDESQQTFHHTFINAVARYQDEAILLTTTVKDLVMLAGVLHARLLHQYHHDPARATLERLLESCLQQLDTLDPVLRAWLVRESTVFAPYDREAEL